MARLKLADNYIVVESGSARSKTGTAIYYYGARDVMIESRGSGSSLLQRLYIYRRFTFPCITEYPVSHTLPLA